MPEDDNSKKTQNGLANISVNAGDFAKPVSILIQKISNAIGVWYSPIDKVRHAKAEAKAELIKANSKYDLATLEGRAMQRHVSQESRKQLNIDNITAQAIDLISRDQEANPEELDEDWLAYFFEKCGTISNVEMQSIWAKLLAGEASKPGSYSKRTLSVVSHMSKDEAHNFTRLAQCVWTLKDPLGDSLLPLIFDIHGNKWGMTELNWGAIAHLESIGLIQVVPLGLIEDGPTLRLEYFGEAYTVKAKATGYNEDCKVDVGMVQLTQVGSELYPICGAERNEQYVTYVIDKWKELKYSVSQNHEFSSI